MMPTITASSVRQFLTLSHSSVRSPSRYGLFRSLRITLYVTVSVFIGVDMCSWILGVYTLVCMPMFVCISSLSFIPILLNTKYLYETTLKYSGIETDEAPRSVRLNAPMFAEGGRPP